MWNIISVDHRKPVFSGPVCCIWYSWPWCTFSRLKDMFGLSGKVLKWFRSYLDQSSQRVSVHGILSDIQFLLSDIPQRSVLGLLVFTMYTHPLVIITQRYGVKYNLFADDTQLYISLDPDKELNFSSSFGNRWLKSSRIEW